MNSAATWMDDLGLANDLVSYLELNTSAELLDVWHRWLLGEPAPALPTRASRQPVCRRIAEAFADPRAVGRLLDSLSPSAMAVLSLLVDFGQVMPRPVIEHHVAIVAGGPEQAREALAALSARGLYLTLAGRPLAGVTSTVCAALSPFVPPLEGEAPADLAVTRRASGATDDVLVAAAVAAARPKVNVGDGHINLSDLARIEKRLRETAPRLVGGMEPRIEVLRRYGILEGAERLQWNPQCAASMFALPHAEWQRRRVMTLARLSGLPPRLFSVLDSAAPRFVRRATLERIARLARADERVLDGPAGAAADIELLMPYLEEARDAAGAVVVRLAMPEATAAPERLLVVQPNFEILAPPETPAALLASVGRFAELRGAAVFATFRLTEDSVGAAVESGATVEELLALLERHASHGVPQNVAHDVAGWAAARGRVALCAGVTLVFDRPADTERMCDALDAAKLRSIRLASNVVVVALDDEQRARKVLAKLKVMPTVHELDEWSGRRAPMPFAPEPPPPEIRADQRSAREGLRRRIATAIERRAADSPAKPARPPISQPSQERRPQSPPPSSPPPSSPPPLPPPVSGAQIEKVLQSAITTGVPVRLLLGSPGNALPTAVEVFVDRVRQRGPERFLEGTTGDNEYRSIALASVLACQLRASTPGAPSVAGARPGRNDPCHCGSGRKYKKCCLARDEGRDSAG